MTAKERMDYFKELDKKAKRLAKQMEMEHLIEMEMEMEVNTVRENELIDRYYRRHAEA